MDEEPNLVMGMFKVFHFDVYVLLDLRSNLSFVTHFLANRFNLSPEILHDSSLVYTPLGMS